MEYRRFIKKLDVPSGFTVPTTLTYDDIVARAISRADLHEDVKGINASIEIIRRTELTEDLLHHDVDVSWWVTPSAYEAGYYTKLHRALRTGSPNSSRSPNRPTPTGSYRPADPGTRPSDLVHQPDVGPRSDGQPGGDGPAE